MVTRPHLPDNSTPPKRILRNYLGYHSCYKCRISVELNLFVYNTMSEQYQTLDVVLE